MRIGQHFGKRKHMWDYLNSRYVYFSEIDFDLNVRLFSYSFLLQCLFMSPVVYWLFQNYSLAETIIQHKLSLKENMQFEKKWMVFLLISMTLTQSAALVFVLKKMVLNFYFPESNAVRQPTSLKQVNNIPKSFTYPGESLDEVADRRRVS